MQTKKILVIDDDQSFLNAIKFILKNQDLEILTAIDGESGLKCLYEHEDIQVVIIDLAIGEPSGVDVLMQIKSYQRPLRRIVLTAHDEELPYKEAEELKVFAYLNKPIEKHSLIFSIKSAFKDLYLEKLETLKGLERQFKEMEEITTNFALWVKNKLINIPNHLDLIQERIQDISASNLNLTQSDLKELSSFSIKKFEKIRRIVEEVINIDADLLKPFEETESEVILVDEILKQVIASVKRNDINIDKEFKSKNLKTKFNKSELIEIFKELINNAVTAMENSPQKKLSITSFEGANNEIFVKIKDSGHGIKKEDADKIFKAFSADKNSKGYGIGLFKVKNILAKFGGTIEFTSKYGEGTEFTINLKRTEK